MQDENAFYATLFGMASYGRVKPKAMIHILP